MVTDGKCTLFRIRLALFVIDNDCLFVATAAEVNVCNCFATVWALKDGLDLVSLTLHNLRRGKLLA